MTTRPIVGWTGYSVARFICAIIAIVIFAVVALAWFVPFALPAVNGWTALGFLFLTLTLVT